MLLDLSSFVWHKSGKAQTELNKMLGKGNFAIGELASTTM